jgi:hypothetical protein
MAPAKRRTGRKRAGRKAAVKPKPRSRAAAKAAKPGRGHNNPPASEVLCPPPAMPPRHTDDETTSQIVRDTAAHRRSFTAPFTSGTVGPGGPPFALANDPRTLHEAMLKGIAALEETIAQLPPLGAGGIGPRPLDDSEIEESKRQLAELKNLPLVPTQRPPEAVRAQSRLKALGEKVLESLATDAAKQALTAALKALYARYGDQAVDLARAVAEWLASLG